MNDWNDAYDDDYDDDQNDQGVNPKLVKDLRKQLKEKAATEKALADKVADFEKRERTRNVASVLSAKGVNPKVAKLVPEGVGEDEESVGKWLEDFGDVFGVKPDADTDGDHGQTSTVDTETQAATQRMMQTTASGKAPESAHNETLTKLQNAPVEDVLKMIAEAKGVAA